MEHQQMDSPLRQAGLRALLVRVIGAVRLQRVVYHHP